MDAGAPLGYPLARSLLPSVVTGAHLSVTPGEEVHLLVRTVTLCHEAGTPARQREVLSRCPAGE